MLGSVASWQLATRYFIQVNECRLESKENRNYRGLFFLFIELEQYIYILSVILLMTIGCRASIEKTTHVSSVKLQKTVHVPIYCLPPYTWHVWCTRFKLLWEVTYPLCKAMALLAFFNVTMSLRRSIRIPLITIYEKLKDHRNSVIMNRRSLLWVWLFVIYPGHCWKKGLL